jgi:hypothetical protein
MLQQPPPAACGAQQGSATGVDIGKLDDGPKHNRSHAQQQEIADRRGPAVDLLALAIERVRPMLADASLPTKTRIRLLWAAARIATDLAAADVVESAFAALAIETDIIDTQGRWTGGDIAEDRIRHGAEDVAHVIKWALRGWNPFETGPLT